MEKLIMDNTYYQIVLSFEYPNEDKVRKLVDKYRLEDRTQLSWYLQRIKDYQQRCHAYAIAHSFNNLDVDLFVKIFTQFFQELFFGNEKYYQAILMIQPEDGEMSIWQFNANGVSQDKKLSWRNGH